MKQKIRKILYISIMTCIFLLIGNKAKAATTTISGVTYTYDVVNGNAENVWVSDGKDSFSGAIPGTLDGHTVVSIGNGTANIYGNKDGGRWEGGQYYFPKLDPIEHLEIPNTVTKINDYAFYSTSTQSGYTLPNSLRTIGKYAFAESHVYSNDFVLTIPNSVETIDKCAFSNTFTHDKVQSMFVYGNSDDYYYPDGIYRRVAKNIVLGTGVKTIGQYAFAFQPHLTGDIVIPSSTTTIGEEAFRCSGITGLTFADRTTNITVGNRAFTRTHLNSAVLKNNITLGESVFGYNNYLENVTVPTTFATIPEYTFSNCPLLSSAVVNNIISHATTINDFAFLNCDGLVEEIIIPSTVTSMGKCVFQYCDNLEKATVNARITDLPDSTFESCKSLKNVTLSNNITRIQDSVFRGCISITTEELSDLLTNIVDIGNRSFESCDGLTGTIHLNTTFGTYAFANCKNIEKVVFQSGSYPYSGHNGAFKNCIKLEDVDFEGDGYLYVDDEMFYGCEKLTMDVVNKILNNTNYIDNREFMNCTGLEGELVIPSHISNVGDQAFYNDTGITKITFSERNTSDSVRIGDKTFGNIATSQTVVKLPNLSRWWNIGSNAFSNIEEAYVDMNVPDGSIYTKRWWGTSDNKPFVHFKNCTHRIDIECNLPGVKLVNPDTNEEIESLDAECESDFSFKLVVDEAYADKYPDLVVKLVSEGQYVNSPKIESILDMNSGDSYTIENVTRGKKIIVQSKSEGTDLVLRQFISELNGNTLNIARIPTINILDNGKIEYLHTKYPRIVKKNDYIKYTVRVYNEGAAAGNSNEITVKIPEGLKFMTSDETNSSYEWTVSEDGKTITTRFLENKEIPAYRGSGRPNYKEVEYVLQVEEDSSTELYMATLAEITDGNDIDSVPGYAIDKSLDNLMYDESMASTTTSYIHFREDDCDYEDVLMEAKASTEYSLVINKIDSKTDELLNGAKFELLNENEEVIKTAVTEDGSIDFGSIITYGEGTDTYYLREVETPVGYKKTINGLMEISIVKKLNTSGELEITIFYDLDEIDDEDDITDDLDVDETIIPISNQIQLSQIGTDNEVSIDGTTYTFSKDAHYKLVSDIAIVGENWPGIEDFTGTFDGDDHTISGLKMNINNAEKVGLFKQCSGKIIDLTIDNAAITGTTTVESPKIGVFVGYMTEGTLTNCKLTNSSINTDVQNVGGLIGHTKDWVKLNGCSVDENTTILAKYNVGGLVGCSVSQIDIYNCTNASSVTGTDYNVGGIVGFADKAINIKNSSNSGTIKSTEIITRVIEERPNPSSPNFVITRTEYEGCNNIGGIVGYVNSSSVINATECSNTGVVNGLNNIGGIVGYSEAVTNMTLCENSGEVTAVNYNAGGLAGHVEPKGEASSQTVVNIDENHVINLYIRNKSTKGKYLLNIYALDASNSEKVKLTGAKFSVYNANKDVIVENQEVDSNGNIKLDNNILNSLVSDVFFIKEVEAPEGYESLIKDYIMLEVEKTWNAETEKYEISGVSQVVTDMDGVALSENIVANANGEELPNEAGSGRTAENTNNDENTETQTIYYKSTKAVFETCTNNGKVSAYDAGGIVGLSRGFTEIRNSDNTGEISSTYDKGTAGGIVGDMSIQTLGTTSRVTGCSNSGKITSANSGGIVGTSGSIITVEDSENSGEIVGTSYNAGGIIGVAFYNTTLVRCTNTGEIKGAEHIGGIIATSGYSNGDYDMKVLGFYIPNDYLRIEDCTVSSMVFECAQPGGIISVATSTENFITGCRITDCTFTGSESTSAAASATIATYHGAELTVDDVVVKDCIITSPGDAGGIVGGQYGWHTNGDNNTAIWDRQIYKFNNIQILGCIISGNDASGVMATYCSTGSHADTVKFEFSDCYVGASEKNEVTRINSTRNHSGGLLGNVYGYYGNDMKYKFTDCTVENAAITSVTGSAGIFGYIYELCGEVIFTNCNVKTSNITGKEIAGGIFGGTYDCTGSSANTIVDNCLVESTEIKGGRNLGGFIGEAYDRYSLKRIQNSTIRDSLLGAMNNSAQNGGALIGYTYGCNAEMDNCIIEGVDINNISYTSFGIGEYTALNVSTPLKYKDITMKAYEKADGTVKKNSITADSSFSMGGLLGSSYYVQSTEIEGINISDVEFSGPAHHIGTIAGCLGATEAEYVDVNDVNISNIKMDVKNASGSNVGGAFGLVYISAGKTETKMSNININNIDIENAAFKVAGFIGNAYFSQKEGIFSDINLNNVNINVTNAFQEVAGFIANMFATNQNIFKDCNISNLDVKVSGAVAVRNGMVSAYIGATSNSCKVSGIEIKDSRVEFSGVNNAPVHVAGIICGSYGNDTIEDIDIDGLTLINKSTIPASMTGGIKGYVDEYDDKILDSEIKNITIEGYGGGVAGVLGGGYSTISNVTVTNPNIKGMGTYSYAAGIAGLLMGDRTISNAVVTADSDTTGTIECANIAAGIVAIDNGFIKDSSVSNIKIKTAFESETTIEADDDGAPESITPGYEEYAGIFHGLFLNGVENCTSENVTVIHADE